MGSFDFFMKTAGLHKLGNTRAYDEEYSTEMYDKVFNTENAPPYSSYSTNGVRVNQTDVKIVYDGILAKNGAQDVYAVVGYGSNQNWEDIETFRMNNLGNQTFELTLPVKRSGSINMAFKDNADNWDNNRGNNYTLSNLFYQGSH